MVTDRRIYGLNWMERVRRYSVGCAGGEIFGGENCCEEFVCEK